jgi:hypothetical protein
MKPERLAERSETPWTFRPPTLVSTFVIAELAAAAALAGATGSAQPCRAPLPTGPAVPAPIVFRSGCGGFLLRPNGAVSRLPRGWFAARSGGTGRRYGADLQLRRNRTGRVFLLRRGQLIWRSADLYPNTGGDVAFGPGRFAFASYQRGVFLTDLRGAERLVVAGRGRYPFGFFASGRLIATGADEITVVGPDGRVERRYRHRPGRGFSLDDKRNTLYFVTPGGRLATLRESRLRIGRRLDIDGSFGLVEPRRLLFYGVRSLTLASLDGRPLARVRWPKMRLDILDSGAAVSPDGRFVAYRLSDARAGARTGHAVLYVLQAPGTQTEAVYRHRLGPIGCGVGASMYWHRDQLLYGSADGQLAIIDGPSGRRRDLSALVAKLPRRGSADRPFASWLADYR